MRANNCSLLIRFGYHVVRIFLKDLLIKDLISLFINKVFVIPKLYSQLIVSVQSIFVFSLVLH